MYDYSYKPEQPAKSFSLWAYSKKMAWSMVMVFGLYLMSIFFLYVGITIHHFFSSFS